MTAAVPDLARAPVWADHVCQELVPRQSFRIHDVPGQIREPALDGRTEFPR